MIKRTRMKDLEEVLKKEGWKQIEVNGIKMYEVTKLQQIYKAFKMYIKGENENVKKDKTS